MREISCLRFLFVCFQPADLTDEEQTAHESRCCASVRASLLVLQRKQAVDILPESDQSDGPSAAEIHNGSASHCVHAFLIRTAP